MKKNDKTFIIAEAGVNHNGQLDLALKLCDAVKSSGADAIKFQTWKTEHIITKATKQAEYQIKNAGQGISQFEMLKNLELSYDEFVKIKNYCDRIDIQFLSTADDPESLDFLIDLGVPLLKIGSGEITNIPFLRYIGEKKLPIIFSTGMSTLADTDIAYRTLRNAGAKELTILHCTTSYPCPYNSVNLNVLKTLAQSFQCPVGYSDHTIGDEIAVSAVAMGASVIEKHFTLDKNMPGPDHKASTNPKDFSIMVKKIRNVELALGSQKKEPTILENKISKVVLKRIVAIANISKDEIFTKNNITVKRNETGLPANLWDYIIGTAAKKDFCIDDGIVL